MTTHEQTLTITITNIPAHRELFKLAEDLDQAPGAMTTGMRVHFAELKRLVTQRRP